MSRSLQRERRLRRLYNLAVCFIDFERTEFWVSLIMGADPLCDSKINGKERLLSLQTTILYRASPRVLTCFYDVNPYFS
jgi:hypothetical protein